MNNYMIKTVKHIYNIFLAKTRDMHFSIKRSSKWPKLEKEFLIKNPKCAACGSTKRLNVHHIIPFHLDKERELDINNLITLCMSKNECHLRLAHGSLFRAWVPDIKLYIKQIKSKEKTLEEMCKIAKANRQYK